MCRSCTEGGRRCPSNRGSRKRAQQRKDYQNKKLQVKHAETYGDEENKDNLHNNLNDSLESSDNILDGLQDKASIPGAFGAEEIRNLLSDKNSDVFLPQTSDAQAARNYVTHILSRDSKDFLGVTNSILQDVPEKYWNTVTHASRLRAHSAAKIAQETVATPKKKVRLMQDTGVFLNTTLELQLAKKNKEENYFHLLSEEEQQHVVENSTSDNELEEKLISFHGVYDSKEALGRGKNVRLLDNIVDFTQFPDKETIREKGLEDALSDQWQKTVLLARNNYYQPLVQNGYNWHDIAAFELSKNPDITPTVTSSTNVVSWAKKITPTELFNEELTKARYKENKKFFRDNWDHDPLNEAYKNEIISFCAAKETIIDQYVMNAKQISAIEKGGDTQNINRDNTLLLSEKSRKKQQEFWQETLAKELEEISPRSKKSVEELKELFETNSQVDDDSFQYLSYSLGLFPEEYVDKALTDSNHVASKLCLEGSKKRAHYKAQELRKKTKTVTEDTPANVDIDILTPKFFTHNELDGFDPNNKNDVKEAKKSFKNAKQIARKLKKGTIGSVEGINYYDFSTREEYENAVLENQGYSDIEIKMAQELKTSGPLSNIGALSVKEFDGEKQFSVSRKIKEVSFDTYSVIRVPVKDDNDDNRLGTTAHETSHFIEDNNTAVKLLANSFLDSRGEGEKPSVIYPGTNEIGYRDGFSHHYIGKLYMNKNTEINSMGNEDLVHANYGAIGARKQHNRETNNVGSVEELIDPGHRAFILGNLAAPISMDTIKDLGENGDEEKDVEIL